MAARPTPSGTSPNTTTLSGGLGWLGAPPVRRAGGRLTPWRATAIGSLRAATFERDVVGYHLEACASHRVRDQEVFGEAAARSAVADDPARRRHWVDDDMVAHRNAGDVAADLDDLARRLVALGAPPARRAGGRHVAIMTGIPPIEMKSASVPQIPHARILTRTSAGPTVGLGMSTTCDSTRRCHYGHLH